MKKKHLALIVALAILTLLYLERDTIFAPRYLGDLHVHTTCSDGKNRYEAVVEKAIASKLNFVAITDHTICPEVVAKCKAETKLLCIPGQEVTGERLHVLALNVNKYVSPNLPLLKQVQEIHKSGGLAIAAHPNADIFYYSDSELKDSGFDAQECTKDSKERRFLPCVYNSDAHKIENLAWQFNSCLGPIKNFEDLKGTILSNKCVRTVNLHLLSEDQPLKW